MFVMFIKNYVYLIEYINAAGVLFILLKNLR